jgi:hypothetical protein
MVHHKFSQCGPAVFKPENPAKKEQVLKQTAMFQLWAAKVLPEKNALVFVGARQVEDADPPDAWRFVPYDERLNALTPALVAPCSNLPKYEYHLTFDFGAWRESDYRLRSWEDVLKSLAEEGLEDLDDKVDVEKDSRLWRWIQKHKYDGLACVPFYHPVTCHSHSSDTYFLTDDDGSPGWDNRFAGLICPSRVEDIARVREFVRTELKLPPIEDGQALTEPYTEEELVAMRRKFDAEYSLFLKDYTSWAQGDEWLINRLIFPYSDASALEPLEDDWEDNGEWVLGLYEAEKAMEEMLQSAHELDLPKCQLASKKLFDDNCAFTEARWEKWKELCKVMDKVCLHPPSRLKFVGPETKPNSIEIGWEEGRSRFSTVVIHMDMTREEMTNFFKNQMCKIA